MFINVEMNVDSRCIAFMPARWTMIGLPVHDAVVGVILKIDRSVDPKIITVESKNHDGTIFQQDFPDYRVKQFTFGSIWVKNGDYDEDRIEAEDRKKLENEMNKKK